MGDARVRWLLGLALALAVLRLAIVPWARAQDEQRQQLEVLTQRLDRSAGVVGNSEAMLAAQGKVAAAAQAARKPYPEVADKERFRLDAQRMLAGIAARGGAKVVLFDWVLDGEAGRAGLAYGRVKASINGPLENLVAVHGQIEGELPFAAIREIKVDLPRGGASGLSADEATFAFVMDLYYRPAQAAAPAAASPASEGAR